MKGGQKCFFFEKKMFDVNGCILLIWVLMVKIGQKNNRKKFLKSFAVSKKRSTFASQLRNKPQLHRESGSQDGPFVYRLGREIFIL